MAAPAHRSSAGQPWCHATNHDPPRVAHHHPRGSVDRLRTARLGCWSCSRWLGTRRARRVSGEGSRHRIGAGRPPRRASRSSRRGRGSRGIGRRGRGGSQSRHADCPRRRRINAGALPPGEGRGRGPRRPRWDDGKGRKGFALLRRPLHRVHRTDVVGTSNCYLGDGGMAILPDVP